MIPALGAGGPGFESRMRPLFVNLFSTRHFHRSQRCSRRRQWRSFVYPNSTAITSLATFEVWIHRGGGLAHGEFVKMMFYQLLLNGVACWTLVASLSSHFVPVVSGFLLAFQQQPIPSKDRADFCTKNGLNTQQQQQRRYQVTSTELDQERPESSFQPPVFKVVVVGGGVGGLAVAARIAASTQKKNSLHFKCQVTLLEKNNEIGGRCGSFNVDIPNIGTFRHERGPSLLLLPNVYREVFQDCSTKPAEDFGLILDQCIPAYQVVFEDGDSIEVGFPHDQGARGGVVVLEDTISENESRSRTKMDTYEEDGAKKWDEYLQSMSAFLDCGLPNFIEEKLDLLSLPAFLYEALRDSAKVRKWWVRQRSWGVFFLDTP
jgi:hypothetical protein